MKCARAHGIPLSVFRGWSEPDRAMALGLQQYEDSLCSGCGQPMHESMDRANERRYVADLPSRCHACTTLGHRMAEYSGDNVTQPQALRFGVHLKGSRPSSQS